MRLLWIGDPHATPEDLRDARALIGHVEDVARRERPDVIVLAGDLYHTHAVIHAEVQLFWREAFEALGKLAEVVVIKGNHDAPGDQGSKATALLAHLDQVEAVLYEPRVYGKLLFCPYTDGETLVRWSNEYPECTTLFCHQTFDGSTYENGFYAEDGIKVERLAQERVISGHIHTPQSFFRVWYPGAPRWRTLSDANVERAIWIMDFDQDGALQHKKAFDTGAVCRRIFAVVDTDSNPLDPEQLPRKDGDVYHVEIRGPQAFIDERRPLWDAFGARVRGIRSDGQAKIKVRESDGVAVAFRKWLTVFTPKNGTDKDVLKKMVEERLHGF
jgi:DNA repair exonuclease SbcCD nuclease subunit